MTREQTVIAVALGVLAILCLIVGATLNHYIGGFLQTVAREEEEQDAADPEGDARGKDRGEQA